MTVLITGGAGYIGSHMVRYLLDRNIPVIVLDNFSTSHPSSLPPHVPIYQVDLRDDKKLDQCFSKLKNISAVIHFAGLSIVSESFEKPLDYYANNVYGTLNLLKSMNKQGVRNIVFSSTAAVYGLPRFNPITEQHLTKPINPYGESKLAAENLLKTYFEQYAFHVICLRYFNAAGADTKNGLGENHHPETHLIPILLKSLYQEIEFSIYGDDYKTPDGTCIRDYVHVLDLCEAHLLSLTALKTNPGYHIYNLGNGTGNSILELIRVAEKVTAKKAKYKISPKRKGDPPILIADPNQAYEKLGWRPKYTIEKIMQDAWEWHSNHPSSQFAESMLKGLGLNLT